MSGDGEKERRFTEEFMASWERSSRDDIPSDKQKILQKQAELLSKNPRNERIWFARGVLFSDIRKYDQAIECFEKVIIIDPKNKDVYNALGEAYRNMGMHKEAASMFSTNRDPFNQNGTLVPAYTLFSPSAVKAHSRTRSNLSCMPYMSYMSYMSYKYVICRSCSSVLEIREGCGENKIASD